MNEGLQDITDTRSHSLINDTGKQEKQKLSAHPGQMAQPAEDKEIKCIRYNEDGTKCNATFISTVDDQQAYKARDHSEPRSCAKRRKSAGYNANNGSCRKLMAGTCETEREPMSILSCQSE